MASNDELGNTTEQVRKPPAVAFVPPRPLFMPPVRKDIPTVDADSSSSKDLSTNDLDKDQDETSPRTRRRRGRRSRKRRPGTDSVNAAGDTQILDDDESDDDVAVIDDDDSDTDADDETAGTVRRRRRRRRGSTRDKTETTLDVTVEDDDESDDDDEVSGFRGSTRLEAKKQRRRDSRDRDRRRRSTIVTEAEFLARRESVERVMVIREFGERTQIAVVEDGILVEHYVTKASATSYAGNIYLGRVQNVLPSMEAAFVDIGKGRNAVLYAGEVNWDSAELEGKPRAIEKVLKTGDSVLVQVTKDPIGQKGARLTSQISLPGRFLVYVPDGSMTGISRKLPDTQRRRLKELLKDIVPDDAGVIVRTAAEGATEEELAKDVARLAVQWETIKNSVSTATAPSLLHGEPELVIRVIRDIFNEDFSQLVVQGEQTWQQVQQYVEHVSPDLISKLTRYESDTDAFVDYRIDEQLMKALEPKVWLPSGGSLVIDRTEAMTVIDVNTGRFIGQGGNLEETVTRNNLEAAEEIVRQLRLRDVGGIVVIDFIDMVLESNRDLVLRRLTECLGRDRTRHQVAEVTSLGLVQMTRKRVGQGLLEAFSHQCDHCSGRGVVVFDEPVDISVPSGKNSHSDNTRSRSDNNRSRRRKIREVSEPEIEDESKVDDEPGLTFAQEVS